MGCCDPFKCYQTVLPGPLFRPLLLGREVMYYKYGGLSRVKWFFLAVFSGGEIVRMVRMVRMVWPVCDPNVTRM